MISNRVVVTGVGLVTCLSSKTEDSWSKVLNSCSGIRKISSFSTEDLPVCIGGEVITKEQGGDFNPNDYVTTPKDLKKYDKFILYGIAAAKQAILDSGILDFSGLDKDYVGVVIGSGIGGLPLIEKNSVLLDKSGHRRVSPLFIPSSLANLVSGNVSIEYGFTGPNDTNVTACSTGVHSIANACRIIKNNEAKVVISGASEGALCPVGISGFDSMRALSRRSEKPELASCPWDKKRDGFVMSDGAGILVLEEYNHAKNRGAKIYGEILGFGLSGDAHHIAAPHPQGDGALKAMERALKMSGKSPSDISYINAHGTSTPLGDMAELNAVKRLFDSANAKYDFAISSTKSSLGHALGAAGSIEAILCLLAMRDSVAPPTINLEEPEEEAKIFNLVPKKPQDKKINCVMSNSFGFGGTNISIVMSKV